MIHATCALVIAILCFGTGHAHASCAVALEGEPAAVESVRAELADFTDDSSACLALWVQCRKASDQLEIDLHDELGRSSLRLFASARGAAAFIVSWSRRPPVVHITVTEPAAQPQAPAPRAPAASAPAAAPVAQDQPWHLELTTSAIDASGNHSYWITTGVALVRRAGIVRFGGELRVMEGAYFASVVGQATASFGLVTDLSDRLTVLADLGAGSTINGVTTSYGTDFGSDGLRAGVRAAIDWRLTEALGLEIEGGYEVLRQVDYVSPPTPSIDYQLCPHLEIGLRWVP